MRGGEHWWAGGKEKEEGKRRKEIRGGAGHLGTAPQKQLVMWHTLPNW